MNKSKRSKSLITSRSSARNAGPDTKAVLLQAKKPTLPLSPEQSTGRYRTKIRDFAELSSNMGKPDMAATLDAKQSEPSAPIVIIRPLDQPIESSNTSNNKEGTALIRNQAVDLEQLKVDNQILDTGFQSSKQQQVVGLQNKRQMSLKPLAITNQYQNKRISEATNDIPGLRKPLTIGNFDQKGLQFEARQNTNKLGYTPMGQPYGSNSNINMPNNNSYTLFDKSLQEDSSENSSNNDPVNGEFLSIDRKKEKDMLSYRRLLSSRNRESIIQASNIKNVNLRLYDQDPLIIERFGPYKNIIENLIEKYIIETAHDLVTCIFSNDSTRMIAVMTDSEEVFSVVMYCTDSFEIKSSLTLQGDYIKARNIAQNKSGNTFAIPFIEDEVFKITIFNKEDVIKELDVSQMIGIGREILPIDAIPYPLITVVFIDESSIFTLCFDHQTNNIWYFSYNISKKKFILEPKSFSLQCGTKNFPVASFYDNQRDLVHTFFRQGQALSINPNEITHIQQQEITKFDIGEMQFYQNSILLVKSSEVIDLYQIEEIPDTTLGFNQNFKFNPQMKPNDSNIGIRWNKYHTLEQTGFVQLTPDSNTFQIIGDELIYFFKFPEVEKEPIPELANTMMNFMLCEQMLISTGERFALAYKVGEPDLRVYLRRFDHGYVEMACEQSREGCIGACLSNSKYFLVAGMNTIYLHDETTFAVVQQVEVPLIESTSREPMQIFNIVLSKNDQYIGLLSGKMLPKQIEDIHQLHVYKISKTLDIELVKQIQLPETYRGVSKQFAFYVNNQDQQVLFYSRSNIILYDYINETKKVMITLNNLLNAQPDYITFNESQEIGIIATDNDILWLNIATQDEVDIDEVYEISCVKAVTLFNDKFYILANKYQKKLGYYLLEIDIDKPMLTKRPNFIIKWTNKLQIDDAELNFIFIERENMKGLKEHKVEMVVSYKTIHINQFVIIVVEMDTCLIKFRFELYQLWESPIKGFMNKSHDFIILNKAGLSFIPLGNQQKKIIKNPDGSDRMVHSLESLSYLKIEDSNHIKITRPQNNSNQRIIWISQQFTDNNGETRFEDLYQVQAGEMTLIELILTQSIFSCKSLAHIYNLIELQPEPSLFFKSYLELDLANMVSILSFDGRCINKMLQDSEQFADYDSKNPLFYKIQHEKYHEQSARITTALDIALESNQISAANLIIQYIQKYQNSYVFLFLFQDNFISLIEKGIKVADLLQSDIFCHQFDFEDWPLIHTDDSYSMAPYNDSIFQLRGKYEKTFINFPQNDTEIREHKEDTEEEEEEHQNVKVYKIKYTINVLPGLVHNSYDKDETSFLELLADTEEDELFSTKVITDTLLFFWEEYGCVVHYTGAAIHFAYVLTFAIYLNNIYMYRDFHHRASFCTAMCICLIYPTVYDFLQCYKQGWRDYFSDMWNWLDQGHIWIGFTNIAWQRFTPDITSIPTQLLMVCVIFLMLIKTFFFLRIFDEMSFLVKMIGQVMHDLKAFLIFYAIICFMFCMLFAVIDLDNFEYSIEEKTRAEKAQPQYPAMEYRYLGKFLGHFCTVIRISIGDFQFDSVNKLPMFENLLYWFLWYVVVTVTCIIFLNFIIAEVSASYQIVKDNIEVLCWKEKAILIKEAEEMLLARFGKDRMQNWKHLFPKYIICREQDS